MSGRHRQVRSHGSRKGRHRSPGLLSKIFNYGKPTGRGGYMGKHHYGDRSRGSYGDYP